MPQPLLEGRGLDFQRGGAGGGKTGIDDALNWLVVMSIVPLIPVRFVPLHDLFSDCDSIALLSK